MREEAIEAVAYLRAKRDGSEFSSAESGGWPERYKRREVRCEKCEVEERKREWRVWRGVLRRAF